jgi:hypothetical protein
MALRKLFAPTAIVLCSVFASARDKKKTLLPADILRARTVLVIIDPTAGVDVMDLNANRLALVNVEQALEKWGRFTLVQEGFTADLVIMVRKGNDKLIQPTIGGTAVNGIPRLSVDTTTSPTQTTTRGGGRVGNSGIPNDPSVAGSQPASPQPQIEADSPQDMFAVYRGSMYDPSWSPLDAPAVWRYSTKDALVSPSVPAVEAFRKLIAESERQLAPGP